MGVCVGERGMDLTNSNTNVRKPVQSQSHYGEDKTE